MWQVGLQNTQQDGNFRVLINGKIMTQYSEIVDFYYSGSEGAYTKTICADPMTYTADGLTYMFLNGIKEFGSWGAIKGAFEYYADVGDQSGEPAPISLLLINMHFGQKGVYENETSHPVAGRCVYECGIVSCCRCYQSISRLIWRDEF